MKSGQHNKRNSEGNDERRRKEGNGDEMDKLWVKTGVDAEWYWSESNAILQSYAQDKYMIYSQVSHTLLPPHISSLLNHS